MVKTLAGISRRAVVGRTPSGATEHAHVKTRSFTRFEHLVPFGPMLNNSSIEDVVIVTRSLRIVVHRRRPVERSSILGSGIVAPSHREGR